MACGRQEESVATAGKELNVVITVAPITSIVENIAGDKNSARRIIPEGSIRIPSSPSLG